MLKRLALGGIVALMLTGCGQMPWENSLRDLEGVPVKDPQKVVLYNNVDLHPNIVLLCVEGVAFATTTREYGDAITRVPEWDRECAR